MRTEFEIEGARIVRLTDPGIRVNPQVACESCSLVYFLEG